MMNVGHSYPGISDMDTIGSSMKFSACVAENEDRNPWAPFRVHRGLRRQRIDRHRERALRRMRAVRLPEPRPRAADRELRHRHPQRGRVTEPGRVVGEGAGRSVGGLPVQRRVPQRDHDVPRTRRGVRQRRLDHRRHQAGPPPPQPAAVPHRDGQQAHAAVRGVAPRATRTCSTTPTPRCTSTPAPNASRSSWSAPSPAAASTSTAAPPRSPNPSPFPDDLRTVTI